LKAHRHLRKVVILASAHSADDFLTAGFPGVAMPASADAAPASFMYMPAGIHTITAGSNNGPIEITVNVDRDTATTLNNALQKHITAGRKPFFDFDHEEKTASAWPTEFYYSDSPQPGVYVKCEWSKPGAEAVTGKAYRGFSGAFGVDKLITTASQPAKIIRAPLCMGGLVNDPAFAQNRPLWAKNHHQPQNQNHMTPEQIAALQAEKAALETQLQAAKAKGAEGEQAVITLKAKLAEGETQILAHRKNFADTVIQAAQARGAFAVNPAKDSDEEKLIARYHKLVMDDPANADLVKNLPGNTAVGTNRLTAGSAGRIQIGNEDVSRVVKAYNEEKNSMSRGIIWARDIRPRFENEWDTIIRAATNTLGTLAGTLVVQRSLDLLKYELPILSRISTDLSDQSINFNQTADVRTRSVPAVSDFDETTGYATNDATTVDMPVTINKHKSSMVSFNANTLASTKRLLFPEQEEGMHYAIGLQMVTDLLALITPANYPLAAQKSVIALDQFARSGVIACSKALNKRKVTGGQRTALLNSDYHGQLETDTTIVGNLINGRAGDSIATGILPPISKVQPYEAPYFPDNAANLVGAVFRADALCLASRVPNDYSTIFPGVTGGGVVQTVTNPDTGMSFMVVMFVDHQLGATFMRLAAMYGVAKGQTPSLQYIASK
jgi:hypothetical protein